MSDFLTLFKYEFKLQFPFKRKGQKFDFVGSLTSLLISAVIIAVVILLISTIANNYVLVEIDKIPNPTARALELMNVFYLTSLYIYFFQPINIHLFLFLFHLLKCCQK